jgi:hypothetical protein
VNVQQYHDTPWSLTALLEQLPEALLSPGAVDGTSEQCWRASGGEHERFVRGISNGYALTRCSLPWRTRTVIQRMTIDEVRLIDRMPAKMRPTGEGECNRGVVGEGDGRQATEGSEVRGRQVTEGSEVRRGSQW